MSLEPASEKRMISLMRCDCETFEVEEAVVVQSETLKHLIEDVCVDSAIPLSNVKAIVLSKVIEYCKKHVESGNNEKDIQDWDKKFVEVDDGMLFELILAANYLNIKSLLELTCHTVANMMKGKSPEKIREAFNIKNDLTPKEEDEIRTENRWVFE